MKWINIGLCLFAVLQTARHVESKIVPQNSHKTSEILSSNNFYNSNNNNNNNNNNLVENELTVFSDDEEQVLEQQINDVDNNRSMQLMKLLQANQKQTVAEAEQNENAAEQQNNEGNTKNENVNKTIKDGQLSFNTTNTTAPTAITVEIRYIKMNPKTTASKSAAAAINSDAAPLTLTPINSNKSRHSYGFLNPFGQLVAFLGSDQLNLRNYNFLFNAERHTVFHLHTSVAATPAAATAARTSERLLNVVSDSIGAAFGVNTAGAIDGPATKVEEVQLYNATSLRQSRFNPFNPTRILIHGWLGGSQAGIYNTIIPEYLKQGNGNYNVFTVDWSRGALADYISASYRVKPVGKVLAKFIDFLQREAGIRYEDLHIIGFSMGAHIAGIAGKHIQTGRLAVIYALDPALPLFRYDNFDGRLTITDADYIEVLHTSVGSYGYDCPLGHVDFYANYGSGQPGCFLNECSHFRAYQLFAESIRSKVGFQAQGCDVKLWKEMTRNRRCPMGTGQNLTMGGDPLDAGALIKRGGVYYFTTNANAPFAKG